jgi:hypothetical protein
MKLQKDKTQIVEFQIEVEGSSEQIKPRLVLKNDSISMMFYGKMKGKNAIFEVSNLDNTIFENLKKVDAEIEVILENKYFTPWKSSIEFESPVKITVTESSNPTIREPKVRIEAKPKTQKKSLTTEGQHKIKINGKIIDVLVTKVLVEENGKTILKIIDNNGLSKMVRLK